VRAHNLEQAIAAYQQALTVTTQEAMPVAWATTMNNLAIAYRVRIRGVRADNLEQAIAAYQQALTVRTQEAMPHDYRQTQRNLGHVYFDDQRWQDAYTAYAAAIETTEMLYTLDEGTQAGRQTELEQNEDLATRAGYCLAQLDRFTEAVEILERGRARMFHERYNTTLFNKASEHERNTLIQDQEQVKIWAAEYRQQPSEAHLTALKQAQTHLATSLANIRQTLPEFMPDGLDFPAIQAIATHCPLIYLATTPQGSMALIVTAKAVQVVWLAALTTEQLDQWLYDREDYRGYLHGINLLGDTPQETLEQVLKPSLQALLPELQQRLITPLLAELTTPTALIIAMDTLNLLPLPACTEMVTLSFAPSARLIATADTGTAPSFLGIGNPSTTDQISLDYGVAEVTSIARLFPQHQLLCEQAATREAVLAQLTDKTHVHFSSHGRFDMDTPLTSALYLAGTDRLNIEDILLDKLDFTQTQLVVLAACQTGISDFQKAPNEVMGFPAVFMHAGVPMLISTLWPVEEISTTLLLQHFYQFYLQEQQLPAQALQQAQTWLREADYQTLADFCNTMSLTVSGLAQKQYENLADYYGYKVQQTTLPFAHPYYWAGFIFSGAETAIKAKRTL